MTVQNENQTLASITFQNYFRMYPKLAGMTGTAMTESEEFSDIYKLDVIEVPTNVDVIRIDADDEVYRTTREKFEAITDRGAGVPQAAASRCWSARSASRNRRRWRRSSRSTTFRTAFSTPAITSRKR